MYHRDRLRSSLETWPWEASMLSISQLRVAGMTSSHWLISCSSSPPTALISSLAAWRCCPCHNKSWLSGSLRARWPLRNSVGARERRLFWMSWSTFTHWHSMKSLTIRVFWKCLIKSNKYELFSLKSVYKALKYCDIIVKKYTLKIASIDFFSKYDRFEIIF